LSLILVLLGIIVVAGCGGEVTETEMPTSAPPTAMSASPTEAPAVTPTVAAATATGVPALPTEVPAATPTAAAAPATGVPDIYWSQTQAGLTAGMFFDPFPPQLGSLITYGVVLTDAVGQPVSDATVQMTIGGGMAEMEGEHDEEFSLELASQGSGVYMTQATVGPSDLALIGISLSIQQGGQVWSFNISTEELPPP